LESSHAARCQEVDLVLHLGDEGTDDDGKPVEQQRRQLVAETLSAGGEDSQSGPAFQHPADDPPLSLAELAEAERRFENRSCVVDVKHRTRSRWSVGPGVGPT
jgi:hypothetical protein